jgi:hypothetical protein
MGRKLLPHFNHICSQTFNIEGSRKKKTGSRMVNVIIKLASNGSTFSIREINMHDKLKISKQASPHQTLRKLL